MNKVYIKINCNEFLRDLFKEFITDLKPLNIWECFKDEHSYLIFECFDSLNIVKKWNSQIDEYLTTQEFNNLKLSDYYLRNDLKEV